MNGMEWSVAWGRLVLWTCATAAGSWLVGRVVASIALAKAPAWVSDRHAVVARASARLLQRRLPWWFLLGGLWLAAGYWPLTADVQLVVARTVFVLVAVSATFALAAIASQAVDVYGALLGPAVPVSSLTRNVVWALTAATAAGVPFP